MSTCVRLVVEKTKNVVGANAIAKCLGALSAGSPSRHTAADRSSSQIRALMTNSFRHIRTNTVYRSHCMAQFAPTYAPFPITVHADRKCGSKCKNGGTAGCADNRRFHRRRPLFPATRRLCDCANAKRREQAFFLVFGGSRSNAIPTEPMPMPTTCPFFFPPP